jgi:hypothetical protein
MWQKSKKIFFVLILIISSPLKANNKVGNGGDAVVCSGGKSSLLDFYEANINTPENTLAPKEIAAKVIAEFKTKAPTLAAQYEKRLNEIEAEIEFLETSKLVDVKDSEHLFVPTDKNCKLKQLALRKILVSSGEKRFLVDSKIWRELDNTHKAGLLMHEIIYEHFSKLGEENSVKARKFNAFLFQLYLKQKTLDQFWPLLLELEMPIYP